MQWRRNLTAMLRGSRTRLGAERVFFELRYQALQRRTQRYARQIELPALLARVREKNLVFTVTAGRTGTMLLRNLLALAPDTTSLHEPEPAFHRYLRRVQRDPAFAREFLLRYKLPAICDFSQRSYCETSHVFCKGFLEPLLDLGIRPNLLVLRRDPRSIALSLLARETVPERTHYGIEFLLSPRDPGVLPLPGWRRMSDYQLVFWYALEMERRQRDYAWLARQRGCMVLEMTTPELRDGARFLRLCDDLGLLDAGSDRAAMLRRHAAIAAIVVNRNSEPTRITADLDSEEAAVWQAVSSADPDLRAAVEQHYRSLSHQDHDA